MYKINTISYVLCNAWPSTVYQTTEVIYVMYCGTVKPAFSDCGTTFIGEEFSSILTCMALRTDSRQSKEYEDNVRVNN